MDLLPENVEHVGIVGPGDKVFRDECIYSYDTPDSPNGVYINLFNFEAVGHDYLDYHYDKHQKNVYLRHKRLKFKIDKPETCDVKPKRLAIGGEGGFDPDASQKDFRFEDTLSLVMMPSRHSIALPNTSIPEAYTKSIDSVMKSTSTDTRPNENNYWDGEERQVSKYALDLVQLPLNKKVPPTGLKCEQCDLTQNLWLNLTDGSILCGRKFYDGTGGNNHALDHYEKCRYPLAVKLGTITPHSVDIFSYPEDDMVLDPEIDKHLTHFGIDIHSMTKTEKSMIELEIDMNEKIGEWSVIQEKGKKLKPVAGAGLTGLINLGNSCYMNSVLQVLFSITEFQNRFTPAIEIYDTCKEISEFNFQMAKLAMGLLSGDYSHLQEDGDYQKGISPRSFKHFVCGLSRCFSTKSQQDAHEFLLFILNLVEQNSDKSVPPCDTSHNPSRCFEVVIEDRIECSTSSKVRYTQRAESSISLHIDLANAINSDEVAAYQKAIDDNVQPPPEIVRPIIKLTSLIESWAKTEVVDEFYSTAIKKKTKADKYSRIAKYPNVLALQIKKFQCGDNWIPKKLDVCIDAPEILDLESQAAGGLAPGEDLMPDDTSQSSTETQFGFEPSSEAVAMLASMGIDSDQAVLALKACNNDTQRAVDYIFEMEAQGTSPPGDRISSHTMNYLPDHKSKLYQLKAFISHMGTSTLSGHYVCHIRKGDQWYIFNDNKVALSEEPPQQFGYLYFYERIAS